MIRWLRSVPISGWYFRSVLIGGALAFVFYYSFFDPVAIRSESGEYLIAVRILDQDGVPIEGARIAASTGEIPTTYEDLGTTGADGMLLGGILSPCFKRVYRFGEPRGPEPVTEFSIIVETHGNRVLLPEKARGFVPPGAQPWSLRQSTRHLSLAQGPKWAPQVEILHATIER